MARILLIGNLLVGSFMSFAAIADDNHVITQADTLEWRAGPPSLPAGAQLRVLLGDPGKEGLYVIRLRFPAGYKIPAHTHPNDEHVTVISGAFHFGLGAKLDETKGAKLTPGGFAHAAKGMQHYAWTSEQTIVQVHGHGPQGISYVNSDDDPRKKSQ
jgi:quercetin dioxygenase-like cupin family protein